ncbi:dihydrofolate reductase [Aureimonas sp. SA4125]|uniref:2-hydroxyacid dehydrogenase n=1 Tax=Aureimonas sp. SA4125 TaxID=2826993 RepID=UPI001CC58C2A|nr:2-hydroxyacid dehydrogenase [Aureimonas sp. SA4125]BDA86063.1 dihydrofolate reductase [Aureimonas sp. SA4125]
MTDTKTIPVLIPGRMHAGTLEALQGLFDVRQAQGQPIESLSESERAGIRGVALMGVFTAEMMKLLPNLEIIAHFGVGYDGVDAGYAAANGIMVTNTPDVLTDEVADTTIGLLLNTVRELSRAEAYLRAGNWEKNGNYPLTKTTLRGRSVGIMGLGRIGLAIARRLEGFGVPIAYYNRSERDDVAYAYHPDLKSLAAAVDTLIVAAPGGAGTDKAVDAAVLAALGPDGVLINIGRGTVVDEDALIAALQNGTIRAAGLDVFAREPHVPQALIDLDNAVLLPHVASASEHTRQQMGNLVIQNLEAWFSGRPPATPVPEAVKAGLERRG